jgi:hypothetical protein
MTARRVQNCKLVHSRVSLCDLDKRRKSIAAGLLECSRCLRQQWPQGQFLREPSVDICFMNESVVGSTHKVRKLSLPSDGQTDCLRRHRDPRPQGVHHYVMAVLVLEHMKAASIHLLLATRLVKPASA